ncbi:MAG TPA: type VI secretion system baseplate subunit TssK [Chthoniobacteraceae bacterium]|jgi:type VI secretion system ImpJ/VasE family protein|nr:type VI secretion system baseplate subunit TssK [Chthoniobacteraceae bacterium]
MSTLIHWHEGLFLQPHHLQSLQRTLLHHTWGGPRLQAPFAYGVVEARLSADELAEGRLRFDPLHVILPSGTVFRYPEDAELPTLDIQKAFDKRPNGFTAGLGLPLWRGVRANTITYGEALSGPAPNLRYRAHEETVTDENSGANPQPVQLLRLNGRLLYADDVIEDLEFMPLVRVVPRSSEERGSSRLADPRYVPATLLLRGSSVLYKLVRDLAAAVAAVRNQLGEQLAASPFDLRALQGSQFEQVSRLRCLHRSAALLGSLVDDVPSRRSCAGRAPLYDVYLALQDLLAELSAIYPAKRVFTWAPYDHDDPYPAFADLDEKIRAFLFPSGTNFRKINLILERGHFFGDVPPGFFQDITGCYLSIETEQSATVLARLVEDRDHFKLLPASFVEELAVRGLLLREERNVPADLPLRAGQYYYRVDIPGSSRHIWDRFLVEPRVAVHFQDPDLSRFKLSLYVTIPPPPASP